MNKKVKKRKIKKMIIFMILIIILLFIILMILNNNINKFETLDKTIPEMYEGEIKYKNVENLFIFKTESIMATDIAKEVGDFYQNKLVKMQKEIKNMSINEIEKKFNQFSYLNGKFINIDLNNFINLADKLKNITYNLEEYEYCEFKKNAENGVEVNCFYKNGDTFKIYLVKNNNLISIIVNK